MSFTNCKALEINGKKTNCNWQIKNRIGYGQEGSVYTICCNTDDNCNYVVKHYEHANETSFKNEVAIHTKFENIGVGIPIIEAFYCSDHGAYIIMEKRDVTIPQYYDYISKKFSQKDVLQFMDDLLHDIQELLRTAIYKKLIHNDTHLNNFMVNIEKNGYYSDLVAIDFGKSIDYSLPKYSNKPFDFDTYINETMSDIEMSFGLLLSNPSHYQKPPEVKKDRYRNIDRNIDRNTKTSPNINNRQKISADLFGEISPVKTPINKGLFGEISPVKTPINKGLFGEISPVKTPINKGLFGEISPMRQSNSSMEDEMPMMSDTDEKTNSRNLFSRGDFY